MDSHLTHEPVRRTYNADEAFSLLGMPRSTGFDLIKRRQFPAPVIRAGRRIYIPKEPLDRLLSGRTANATDESDVAQCDGAR
jgi:predicted DNA-binding transcriptional regulator AlpA